jgi:hypothetical protein
MPSMDSYPKAAMERAMKVQDVRLQAMAKKITWWQATKILGMNGGVERPRTPQPRMVQWRESSSRENITVANRRGC